MNNYSVYGLTIRSEVTLPELPPGTDDRPDVHIQLGDVETVQEPINGPGSERIYCEPGHCRLSSELFGSFQVRDGEEILVDPASPEVTERKTFRHLILNTVLGVLLHQRGLLVLHASAVSVDEQAVVLLGSQGTGKSTTAVGFQVAGHSILEDDVVAIDTDSDVLRVVPGVPEVRLAPDSAEALGVGERTEVPADGEYEKEILKFTVPSESRPLARCYSLSEGLRLRLEEMSGRSKLFELISSTYARGLLSDTDTGATHLTQCSKVINTVPFKKLQRPQSYETLQAVVSLVASDLRSGRPN